MFVLIDKWTLTLKNNEKRSFSSESKASISFIPMRRMSLSCLIMKRKEITRWIPICPNWQMNFNSRNVGKGSFSYETKASMPFIPKQGISLWCPIMKIKEVIIWIHHCPTWQTNFDSKKLWEPKLFKWNQSLNLIYPNEENEFVVPNHENKRDYYMNLCLS